MHDLLQCSPLIQPKDFNNIRLDPESYKESLDVEIIAVVQPVNVNKEDDSAKDNYELRRRVEGKHVEESFSIRPRDQDDHHDDAHLKGENSAKRQKKSKHGTYVMGESSSGQANKSEPGPSTSDVISKFPAVIFPDDDIKERTFRWVNKCVKKFNPYARYSVKHWKSPHAKILYIKRQKEPGKPSEEVYSNSNINQVIKTTGGLGYEHKFVTDIIARRAYDSIVLIIKPDCKNLNRNHIKDMYLLCINSKVDNYAKTGIMWSLSIFIRSTVIKERVHNFELGVESYQRNVSLTAPTITFPGIKKKKMFFVISEPTSYTRTARKKRE
nr:hypothetical protein [Tanacetum cinerariifolium]